jgi:hypothetical protein
MPDNPRQFRHEQGHPLADPCRILHQWLLGKHQYMLELTGISKLNAKAYGVSDRSLADYP